MPSGTFLPPGITTSNVKISTGGSDNQVLTAVDGETAQGEANLTFDGSTLTVIGAVNVGVDDAGHDVTFFGNTASSYMLWDTSRDDLLVIGGNVGIGEASPANLLHVKISDVGVDPHASAQIVLERDGTNYLQFLTGNDGTSGLLFGDEDDIDVAKIYYDHNLATPAMYFVTETKVGMTLSGGASPVLKLFGIDDTGADAGIVFDGEAQDYYIALDDGYDDLVIGLGNTTPTTPIMSFTNALGDTASNNGSINIGALGPLTGIDTFVKVRRNVAHTLTAGDYYYDFLIAPNAAVTTVASGTANPLIATMVLSEPHITNGGVQPTVGATLKINNAPTEAVSNYALWVDDGATRLDGTIETGSWIAGNTTNGYIRFYGDSGSSVLSQFTDTGQFMINETLNGNQTIGLTINQGAADDQILAFKSSDIAHGVTDFAETDTFARFTKNSGTEGGLQIMAFRDDSTIALELRGVAVDDNTAKSSSAEAPVQVNAFKKTSATVTGIGADGNIFAVKTNDATRFLVDEDGQIYATANAHTGDISVGALADKYDDALLVRALDHVKTSAGTKGMIEDKWDDFVKYNEQDLIDAGVLGEPIENGGLLNVTGLQKLHNGAIWQGYTRQMELQERVHELETRLLALEGGK